MMKRTVWTLMAGAILLASPYRPAVEAVSMKTIGFDEMVRQAAVIVRGRVVEMRSFMRGTGVARNDAAKAGVMPFDQSSRAAGRPEAPESAQVRGGSMIFTHVVLETAEALKGNGDRRLEFDLAGGTVDGLTATVAGMPKFDRGADYVLFLREKYESAGDPVLGVREGFFRVVDAAGAANAVVNADFDYVIAIENSRVVPRFNPQRGVLLGRERPAPQMAAQPTPDDGSTTTISAAARRYLTSDEPPMTAEQFTRSIRAQLARQQ